MIEEIFYLILNMSLASCFVIAVLFLLRLYKPLPRCFVYPMWTLAFLRLTMPFALTTRWSLFNFTGNLVKRLITIEAITHGTVSFPMSDNWAIMNMIGAAERYIPIEYKTESLRHIFIIGSSVWAIVAAIMLLATYTLYALICKELKKSIIHIKDNIYYSDALISPVLIGILRPKIILPPGLDPDSTSGKMVLAHEDVHRKRFDNLWRALAIGIACIHWFNPMVWIMLKGFFEDMELSCDETVLKRKKYSADERKAYASILLQFAEEKRILISSSFGRSSIKIRIVNVLNYKRITVIGAVASAAFLLAVALMLITNPSLRG